MLVMKVQIRFFSFNINNTFLHKHDITYLIIFTIKKFNKILYMLKYNQLYNKIITRKAYILHLSRLFSIQNSKEIIFTI